jgi:hypothetical protein
VVRLLLVIEVPNASDEGMMALPSRPFDRVLLCREIAERMIGMIFDDIAFDC